MSATLHTEGIWKRLGAMARRHRAVVAVPYFGTRGAKLLPLRRKSVLVVHCDEACVRAGLVNPSELIQLLKNGVEIHSCRNLHAKVFVFERRAIVGSTNISSRSANLLLEAGIETADREVVAACRSFVLGLCGDQLTEEYLRKLVGIYQPPKVEGPGRQLPRRFRRLPEHSAIWVVPLSRASYDKQDKKSATQARSAAREVSDPRTQSIDDFSWTGKSFIQRLRPGERVVMCTKVGRRVMVSPPARVLAIRKYSDGRSLKAVVAVGVPKHKRARNVKAVVSQLGPLAKVLTDLSDARLVRDKRLVTALGQLWSPGT